MSSALSIRSGLGERTTAVGTVNDLAIRVGTVNGSGSQSANLVLVRALFEMGIPCAAKNVFPSNIEGLPTWFHIRASHQGYIGHHPAPQVLVCMNEQTAAEDVEQLCSGGVCIYRDDLKVDIAGLRDDVLYVAVPCTQLVAEAYPPDRADPGYRDKLRKVINMVYVGVVAGGIGIDMDAVRAAIRRQFPGRKAKAADMNIAAAEAGFAWAVRTFLTACPTASSRWTAPWARSWSRGTRPPRSARSSAGRRFSPGIRSPRRAAWPSTPRAI